MFIADAHCDTLSAIARWNKKMDDCTVTLERMEQGNVYLQTFAMFAGGKGPAGTPYQDAQKMLAASYNLPLEIIRGKLPDAPPQKPTGILSIEGGEVIVGSLEKLAEFDDGTRIRMISLTWNNENEIAYPGKGGSEQPLKPFGRELIAEMDRRGILADVSHLNDAGFWDVCERAKLPVIASHSDCRWLCNHSRNLTKDMVKAIIDKQGFIGVNFYPAFLSADKGADSVTIAQHIDHICQLGGADIVGFGSDFDGIELLPEDVRHPGEMGNLLRALRDYGYNEEAIERIAGKNLLDYYARIR